MEYSMYKTFAAKYKISMRKAINKYKKDGHFGVEYKTKTGVKRLLFYNKGFKRQPFPIENYSDLLPQYEKYEKRNSLISRLKRKICEYCGTETEEVEVHQIRKLKMLNGNSDWEKLMKSMRRKTLIVCVDCHEKIHNNKA